MVEPVGDQECRCSEECCTQESCDRYQTEHDPAHDPYDLFYPIQSIKQLVLQCKVSTNPRNGGAGTEEKRKRKRKRKKE